MATSHYKSREQTPPAARGPLLFRKQNDAHRCRALSPSTCVRVGATATSLANAAKTGRGFCWLLLGRSELVCSVQTLDAWIYKPPFVLPLRQLPSFDILFQFFEILMKIQDSYGGLPENGKANRRILNAVTGSMYKTYVVGICARVLGCINA